MYRQCLSHLLPHWGQLLTTPPTLSAVNLLILSTELFIFHAHAFLFVFYAFAFVHVVMNVFLLMSIKLLILEIKKTQDGEKLTALGKETAGLLAYLRDATGTLLFLIQANHLYRDLVGVYFLVHLPVNAILLMWAFLGQYPTVGAAVSGFVIMGYEFITNIAIHFAMANRSKDVHSQVRRLISLFVEKGLPEEEKCMLSGSGNSPHSTVRLKVALHIEKMNCPSQRRYGFEYSKTTLITFSTFFKVSVC